MRNEQSKASGEVRAKLFKASDDAAEVDVELLSDNDAVGDSRPAVSSYLDWLPPELLLVILQLLDHDGIVNMNAVDARCSSVISSNAELRLHLMSRLQLVEEASLHPDVATVVWKTPSLHKYLSTSFSFFRRIPEIRNDEKRKVTTTFHFGDGSINSKVFCLVKAASRRFEYCRRHLIVVVAGDQQEAATFVDALEFGNQKVFYMAQWPSPEAIVRVNTAGRKFFLIVDKITAHFHFHSMRSIIFLRPMNSFDSHDALSSLNPKEIVLYVGPGDHNQLRYAAHLFTRLGWYSGLDQGDRHGDTTWHIQRNFYLHQVNPVVI